MQAQTRYARCGDVHIAYQVFGAGPVDILLVPNWITHVEAMWELPEIYRPLERLAQHARVIVYDQRGTGLSDPVSLSDLPDITERAEDITAVLDAVGSEQAAIVGWETGGTTAIVFAASQPSRTRALILANATARLFEDDDYPGLPLGARDYLLGQLRERWGITDFIGSGSPRARTDEASREAWARYQRQAASPGTAAALISAAFDVDVRAVLGSISAPTLVLTHDPDDDRVYHRGPHGKYLAEHIPGATLVEIPVPGASHFGLFVDDILSFATGELSVGESERVLATVLVSDIVGSTERAAALGDNAWRDLLDAHDAMVRRQLDRFGGKEIKSLGDGFLVTFDGPGRAIRCAAAIREAARRLGVGVRVGLHTGEIELRGDDIGGIAVHIASRVSALADEGEILASRTVADLLTGSDFRFADRGSVQLKGVPNEWQLYAVME